MRTTSARRALARWFVPLLLAVVELASAGSLHAAQGQKQVLVLYSTRSDAQIAIVGERELPRVLESGLGGALDYYSEYFDRGRFPDAAYELAFSDFLRLKYKGHEFDLVIAMDRFSLEFVDRHRAGLFPESSVVFFADRPTSRPAFSTGLIGELNLTGTLALATDLQPDIRNVFVVSGAASTLETAARAQFKSFEPKLSITYLSGLATSELEQRLASLPSHSIIYYLVVDRDGAGEYFHPLEYIERLVAVANAPMYSWVDSAMGRGIVGGSLKVQEQQAGAIGQLALRVLRGEPADHIPVTSADLAVRQVDWRQLRRWGISEARVPADTVIRFKEISAWDRYKIYVFGAIALLLAQTALIAGLLVQHARRREAEAQVRGNQEQLRASYGRIRDLGARLLHAQEDERARIARELHDDISQQVALLAIDLELLSRTVPSTSLGLAVEAVTRTQGIAKSVHDLSHKLHPSRLRLIGLVAAIRGLQHELSRPDLAIIFNHENVPLTLPLDLTLCLFRVVQEALQNAVKYSQADDVFIHLRASAERLVLTIVDNGIGFDVRAAWGKGLGLISMAERLEASGGTIEIRSTPGAGTRLEIDVPLPMAQIPETVAV
jgi:signal transduction histidine kinase